VYAALDYSQRLRNGTLRSSIAYVSIRQHPSLAALIPKRHIARMAVGRPQQHKWLENQLQLTYVQVEAQFAGELVVDSHVEQHVWIRQHTSAYVSIRCG
jgi:hypothetical protein